VVAPADFLSGLEGPEGVTLKAAAVVVCSVGGGRLLVLMEFRAAGGSVVWAEDCYCTMEVIHMGFPCWEARGNAELPIVF